MSLFLGKIHYWLFNKIQWFEGIEKEIERFSLSENLPVSLWKEEIYKSFGEPTPDKPLEEIIDTSNIHGWLQLKISAAETRQAAWVTKILNESKEYKKDLIQIFKANGESLGKALKDTKAIENPSDIFTILNDYLLEGMPCDRVSEELENTPFVYSYITTTCLHTPYWNSVGGDVANFYELREAFIEAFIEALDQSFTFKSEKVEERRINKIIKK